MMVHVHRGKGAKDRLVPLPKTTLATLRDHWKTHRNARLLFPAPVGTAAPAPRHHADGDRQRARGATPSQAPGRRHQARGIDSYPACLRHALLEEGVNLRVIQSHMGHSSLETTMVYLHLTRKGHEDAYTLIDKLMGDLSMGALQQLFRDHGADYLARFAEAMPANH